MQYGSHSVVSEVSIPGEEASSDSEDSSTMPTISRRKERSGIEDSDLREQLARAQQEIAELKALLATRN